MPITRTLFVLAFSLAMRAPAQQPDTLLHAIPAPPVGTAGGGLGDSVAVDGNLTIAGAPFETFGAESSGVAKVFDSASGALLHVIPNPTPGNFDRFGCSVAISGTRMVVGAQGDKTGADYAGSAYVYDLSSGTPTVPVAVLNNPSPALNDAFGSAVAIFGTRVVIGANQDDTGANAAGSAYVYDLSSGTPTVPIVVLNNPSPAAQSDAFGTTVAISGTRVVVGAPEDDAVATRSGRAYVYDLSSGTPAVPIATLNNPSPFENDNFGWSVAISGGRVVVGARFDSTGAMGAGSAYVYDLGSVTPTAPVVTLNNPAPTVSAAFGSSVGISGTRVAVGAPLDSSVANSVGSACVYDLAGASPTVPVAVLENPSPKAGDTFGTSVSISGTRVGVGTPGDDLGASGAGSAYMYELTGATPDRPAVTLNHPSPSVSDEFGSSVAISGTRMVVGARLEDTGGIDVGSAYVYDLSSGTPTVPVFTLNCPPLGYQDYFGFSAAISGTWVVVGAYQHDKVAPDEGSAYVYDLSSGTPTVPVFTLNNPTPGGGDFFGRSVAISGTWVVVGAMSDDTGVGNAGSAYVYDLVGATPTVPVVTLNNPAPAFGDSFGNSVAISGTRVAVGAYQDGTSGGSTGSVYVYDLSSGTPTVPVITLNHPSPATGDRFGHAVAISGPRVVVGTPTDRTFASDVGSAHVYDLDSDTPAVPVATLSFPDASPSDYFGRSVAISGPRVVVGANGDDTGAPGTGSAYVFDLTSATPTVAVATLNNPSPGVGDNFGWSVAIDGAIAAVSAPQDDTVMLDKGATYVFAPADHDTDDDGLLDLWEYARFGSTGAHDGNDDSDGDGKVELLEQAFDRNPLAPDAAGFPQVVNEGGYLTLTIAKRAGVTYLGQSAATPEAAAFSAMTTTVLVNDAATLKVRDNFPISTGGQRFLRMQVTAAP